VIAHLIHSVYRDDLLDAVRRAVKRLHGAYAIAVLSACEPQRLVAARAGSPLVIGIGADQNYLASDCAALGELTDRFVYLEDGDVALITPERIAVVDSVGSDAQRPLCVVQARDHDAALGPYRHFMQKEIFEQPKAIAATLDGVDTVSPALFGDDETARALLSKTRSVLLLGCGTSYYAGLTAKYWLEGIAGIRAGRDRQRVSLSRDRARSAHAGRGHFAVGRNGRHDRRDRVCTRDGPASVDGDLQRRDQLDRAHRPALLPDARGHRARRRVDQGVHDATRRCSC
jgi:glucosamine 6-phosphate synthetase-like amidotransferase/phosphosugar isomerase protein